MAKFILKTEDDKAGLIAFIQAQKLDKPLEFRSKNYVRDRSLEQNELQMRWYQEGARELVGNTFEELRGICKLQFGVPILRRDNEEYRKQYDTMVKPLPYEFKLGLMMEPCSYKVTSEMNVKQMMEYTDRIAQYFNEQGVNLPIREELQRNG